MLDRRTQIIAHRINLSLEGRSFIANFPLELGILSGQLGLHHGKLLMIRRDLVLQGADLVQQFLNLLVAFIQATA